jgi:hypothetical protein
MVAWLFKKYPRTKSVCIGCGGNFGLMRPNHPYCTRECKQKALKRMQEELLPLKPPVGGEFVSV